MKELEFLNIIKNTLSKNSHIGDDCAYLKDLGIVITQDSLVEDIHFSLDFSSPFQVAYKAIIVNLSDIYAAGAIPKYITISLSLPKSVDKNFITEFYKACEELSNEFDFEIIGGDITGSDSKFFISICAIGLTHERKISSRKQAKVGDYVITTGVHGSSAAGLFLLREKEKGKREKNGKNAHLINSHLMPTISKDFSIDISTKVDRDYAMMDTSDGLIDALFKIAQSSHVAIAVNFDKIPYDKEIEKIAESAGIDFKEWIFYGGEDYQLIACIDKENLEKLKSPYTIIGKVKTKEEDHFIEINFQNNIQNIYDLEKTFNHF